MSDTPRTEAQVALENPIGTPGNTAIISTDFARQLERELEAMTQTAEGWMASANKWQQMAEELAGAIPMLLPPHDASAVDHIKADTAITRFRELKEVK